MFQNKFHEEDRFFKINSNLKACLKDNFIFMLNSEPLWEKKATGQNSLFRLYIYFFRLLMGNQGGSKISFQIYEEVQINK